MGVSDTDLPLAVPNIDHYSQRKLAPFPA